MKNCMYFASEGEKYPEGPRLALGYGFSPSGDWRPLPLPRAEALAVDDRFPPNPAGLREAERFLRQWDGWVLWDFERPLSPALRRLTELREGVVPAACAAAPHSGVLIGPYAPGEGFARWLERQRRRYGTVVLDAAPIRCLCRPGGTAVRCGEALPESGFFCAGAYCLCASAAEGEFLFWDSRETLRRRCAAAGVPAVVLTAEWDLLG